MNIDSQKIRFHFQKKKKNFQNFIRRFLLASVN